MTQFASSPQGLSASVHPFHSVKYSPLPTDSLSALDITKYSSSASSTFVFFALSLARFLQGSVLEVIPYHRPTISKPLRSLVCWPPALCTSNLSHIQGALTSVCWFLFKNGKLSSFIKDPKGIQRKFCLCWYIPQWRDKDTHAVYDCRTALLPSLLSTASPWFLSPP